jgi:NAD(P)-dependent dehydrogenase (short-subunit alcohol dehydrogenase family)
MSILDRFSLRGKTALVTGGAGLYGRQLVIALAEAGAETYTASRNIDALEAFAESCRAKNLNVKPLPLDLGDEASILALRDRIVDESGRCDVLVNNAVSRPMKRGMDDDAAAFADSMRVNATGLFVISRAIGDAMAERGEGGSIINIASIQGMIGTDKYLYEGTSLKHGFYPDYYFHKGGMINFTRFLASYYGPKGGIRCNAISPGGYGDDNDPLHLERYRSRTLLGRRADDSDLQGSVVFLASDASLYITGANLPVDAGYTAI